MLYGDFVFWLNLVVGFDFIVDFLFVKFNFIVVMV